jgi:hypothetical protein
MNIIDQLIKYSGVIIIVADFIVIAGFFIWTACINAKKRNREAELEHIWHLIWAPNGLTQVPFELFERGMHIHNYYDVLFPPDCRDRWSFYGAMYASIQRRKKYLIEEHEKSKSSPQYAQVGLSLQVQLDHSLHWLDGQQNMIENIVTGWTSDTRKGMGYVHHSKKRFTSTCLVA